MTAPRSMERVAARSSRAESGDALAARWGVPSPSAHQHERADGGMSGGCLIDGVGSAQWPYARDMDHG
jgi:hypothetical protein